MIQFKIDLDVIYKISPLYIKYNKFDVIRLVFIRFNVYITLNYDAINLKVELIGTKKPSNINSRVLDAY